MARLFKRSNEAPSSTLSVYLKKKKIRISSKKQNKTKQNKTKQNKTKQNKKKKKKTSKVADCSPQTKEQTRAVSTLSIKL